MTYKTTDGKTFDNKHKAVAHAIKLSPGNPKVETIEDEILGEGEPLGEGPTPKAKGKAKDKAKVEVEEKAEDGPEAPAE
jgi:hypothetical protein